MDWEEGKIISAPLEEQMKTSYIDYAMSVIVARALPLCDAGSWYASGQTI